MTDYEKIREEFISYLLSEYPSNSKPDYLENVLKNYFQDKYTEDYIELFWQNHCDQILDEVVEETNKRIENNLSLRFFILDDIGHKIEGIENKKKDLKIEFQNCLYSIKDYQFEKLSAIILKMAGCHQFWVTPQSHDQGLDSFGYSAVFSNIENVDWLGGTPLITFLAQAKHYNKEKVCSHDIREYVGSTLLAINKIYAVLDEKYKDLDIKIFSPGVYLFITSGEIKYTAKLLAQKSGIILLTSDTIFSIFCRYWKAHKIKIPVNKENFKNLLLSELKQAIPKAN